MYGIPEWTENHSFPRLVASSATALLKYRNKLNAEDVATKEAIVRQYLSVRAENELTHSMLEVWRV